LTTKIDQSGLNKGMASLKGAITKLGAAIGVAFGVRALVQFGKQAVQLASDLQEVQNVVDVAFGDMAYRMEQFADTAIETFGISELTAKQTGSSFMAMAKGMQFADDVAADMALTLTGLSADMASFYNIRQEEAKTALSAVYTGETETLKRYGILITEVNLQEFARQQGITKSINAMTQQEKVMLRYQYILQATQLAQGDFVRTQDSWANQTRILSERWKEMQTVFGEAFMTIGVLVLPVINNIIVGLTKVAQAAQVVAQWIYKAFTGKELKSSTNATQSQATALSGVGSSAESAADGMADLGSSTKKANKEAKKALAGFDDLEIITSNLADSADSAAGSMGEIGGGIGAMDTNVDFSTEGEAPDTTWLDTFSAKLEPARLALERLTLQLQPLQQFSSQALQDFYNLFLVPVGNWILGEGFPRFVDAISKQLALVDWSRLNGALENLWNSVTPFAINVGEGLLWFWENVITPLISWSLNNLIPAQIDLISAAISFLNELIEIAEPALQWIWDNFFVPLRDYTWQLVIDFIDLLTKTFEGLTNWASQNHQAISDIATIFLGFLAGIWIYNTTKAMIPFLENLRYQFWLFSHQQGMFTALGAAINSPALAIGALTAAGLYWVKNWDKIKAAFEGMAGWQKVITVVLGLAAAIAVLWVAISVGVAAAGIVAGLAALGLGAGILAIGNANQKAKASKELTDVPSGRSAISSTVPNKTVGGYSIPGYARGTVVPPNRPHLAWFGDNKQEPEIVSPVSTMKQAFTEAMLELGGNFGGGNTEVVLEIDGREFGRAVVEQGNRENRRIGTRLVIA
jgi:hypothetical protein